MDTMKTKTSGSDQSQWVFNTNKALRWIQEFFESNIKKFLNRFFTSPGVMFYGAQTTLSLSAAVVNGAKIDLTIEAGHGITGDGDMIILPAQIVNSEHDIQALSSTYYVWLHHTLVDDTDSAYAVNRLPSSYTDVNVHQMDSYEVKYDTAWPTGQELTDSLKIAQVDRDGAGALTITDAREKATMFNVPAAAHSWLNDNYSGFDKDGTDSDEYYVGRTTYAPTGLKVLTEPTEPATPLNLRIYDINPISSGPTMPYSRVHFKWGWEKLTGAHNGADANNTIRVTTVAAGDYMALDVAEDELVGQRMYCPSFTSSDQTYLITANDETGTTVAGATVITLEEAYDNESGTETIVIRPNADVLELKVALHYGGSDIDYYTDTIVLDESFSNAPSYQKNMALKYPNPNVNSLFNVYLRAKSGFGTFSSWHTMQDGSYDPDHSGGGQAVVNYTVPFTNILPMLEDTGADITLTPTTSGFQISITGWEDGGDVDKTAHFLEIARTTLDTLDWNDVDSTTKVLSSDRFFEVPTSIVRRWQVGVRPIQNGQVVGTPIVKPVTSGAMGVAPGDNPYFQQLIDLRTYSGTLRWDGVVLNQYYFDLADADFYSPASSATVAWLHNFAAYIQNHPSILKDSDGDEFLIDGTDCHFDDQSGKVYFDLVALTGGAALPPTVDTVCTINTTERGRRIFVGSSLHIEYNAVSASFDSDIVRGASVGSKGVIRVCQNSASGKSYADILNVWENDTPYDFSNDVDFEIRQAYGNMGLLVDCWDPAVSSPNNTCCIRGYFTLYMRPNIVYNEDQQQGSVN